VEYAVEEVCKCECNGSQFWVSFKVKLQVVQVICAIEMKFQRDVLVS